MVVRLVVVDMDGTFLQPDGTVSPRSRALIATLRERGVHFAIATGRPAPSLQPIVDSLGITLPAITFNGACLQHTRAGLPSTCLFMQPLAADLVQRIVTLVHGPTLGLAVSFSARSHAIALVHTAEQRRLLSEYEQLEDVKQQVVETAEALWTAASTSSALKIVGLSNDPEADAATARAALAGEPVHVIAAEMHIEFVDAAVNKAAALDRLCGTLLVPMREVLAFGDGNNDAEMLSAVGVGVAMANARPAAKAAAAQTLAWTNAEDGVARKCEELLAEGRLVGSGG